MIRKAARNTPLLSEVLASGSEQPPVGGDQAQGRESDTASLSVVITARNEREQIGSTVRSFLRQQYPGLEIIVVDDRSSDGTAEILDQLASSPEAGGGRLQVLHSRELPEGWIGKCHACHLGAQHTRGDWILFTDGDVCLVDDRLLARVVTHAERHRFDHVAVIPDLTPMTAVQAGLVAAFGQLFLFAARAHEMDRDHARGGAGIGAFNLVRRSSYERVGGHRLLRMDLADDFKLGRLLKESGARQRLFNGLGLVRCRWHRGALGVLRGLEKNLFGGFDYAIWKLLAWTAATATLNFGPAAIAALATLTRWGPGGWLLRGAAWLPLIAQTALTVTAYIAEARRYGAHPAVLTFLSPISCLLLIAAAWNSMLRTLWRGGVLWRETFYPLALLKQGLVRPGVSGGSFSKR
ncbi:MAG: glycosyltransferase family 2 protein [Acidobacteriota bacterium]